MKLKINKLMAIGVISLFYLSTVTATGVIQTSDLGEKNADRNVEWEKKVEQNLDSYESVWERPFSRNNYSQKNNFSDKISSHTPHLPIRIYDNDDFTKRNGVIAGNGTKENPYIIKGWEIKGNIFWKMINRILWHLEHLVLGSPWDLASLIRNWARKIPVCGICLRNTNEHVIIKNNYMHDWKDSYGDRQLSGIKIINASNITIENNVIEKNTRGICMANIQQNQICESSNITIRSNNLVENGDCAIRAYYTYNSSITYNNITGGTGVYSYKSRLFIAHNNIFDNGNGIICSDGDHSVIENNFIAGNGNGIYCTGGHQIISDNHIHQNMFGIHSSYASPIITNNTITHNGDGIYHYGFEHTPIIADNIISNNSWNGINCEGRAIIEHNLISSNEEDGIRLAFKSASILNNIISLNGENGIIYAHSAGGQLTPHYNNIFGNEGKGIKNGRDAIINATYNWWGSPDGPSGYGNGHGDEVDKNIIYDPWLTEPNSYTGPRG
jgi:parallel beta-helix repeat protein